MRAVGICITIPKPKRPAAQVVVLDDGGSAPTGLTVDGLLVVENFTLPARQADIEDIMVELLTAVRGRLGTLGVEAATIRRAERPKRANNFDGPRYRLLAEGAVVAAVKEVTANTHWRNGKQIASTCSVADAATVDAAAESLPGVSGESQVHAAAAALASLIGDR